MKIIFSPNSRGECVSEFEQLNSMLDSGLKPPIVHIIYYSMERRSLSNQNRTNKYKHDWHYFTLEIIRTDSIQHRIKTLPLWKRSKYGGESDRIRVASMNTCSRIPPATRAEDLELLVCPANFEMA